ncbi:histidine kinase [Sphingomonas sp. MG17]|uniref:Histidine kinase n=1 Tax=Sphingomonas tagetis TaxID=2949092 RepID=A0A9X2HM44_9SPHN|nr:histidine kinase [Sphingomonas tagetis]MCP3729843.1 histidine kinase [Sphingomonas tagetis]
MPVEHRTEPASFTVPPRIALLSIVGFWVFYFVSVTARAAILARPGYNWMTVDNRAWVALCGIGFTWLLYLALQRFSRRTLRARVAAAFLLSAACATAYSTVNYLSFYVYDPLPPELEHGKQESEREPKDPAKVIAENALHWYFFILAWAVFYLALSYAGAVRASEREAARLRAAAQTAELRALRYQVNPHFLFNTLNSISALVMAGKRAEAEAMILNLSTFFRTSLASEPTEDVPLAEEIAVQKLYLEIEAVRFPERLRATFDIDPAAAAACVPGLILQPLIENAVKYGVAPARRPVDIRVIARVASDMLEVSVQDDGNGAKALNGTGVGLRNVRDRLAARFGGVASLTAGKRPEGGFEAKLVLPLVTHGC